MNMQQCKQCGGSVPDNATACPVCGSVVVAERIDTSGAAGSSTMQPGSEVQKKKKKPLKIIAIVVAVLLVLGLFSQCSRGCKANDSEYDWPTGSLAQMLPSMNVKCAFVLESEESLDIRVSEGMSKEKYDAYVAECKERGFTTDAKEESSDYSAYNPDGFRLTLAFQSGNEMNVGLEAPKISGSLIWPDYGLATMLPNPGKDRGSIDVDSASQLFVFVGDMSQEEYSAYVDECMAYGFNVGHSRGDKAFSAKDEAGNSLHLEYQGFNTMNISLYAAKEADASESTNEAENAPGAADPAADTAAGASGSDDSATQQSAESTDGDFKAMMDDYERFMDGYIAFMVKYNESGHPASMAIDYAKMLKDYAEWAIKTQNIDEGNLTEDELSYGVEVTSRVNQKLADAAIEVSA